MKCLPLIAWAAGFTMLGLVLVGYHDGGVSRWFVFGGLCALLLTEILHPKAER